MRRGVDTDSAGAEVEAGVKVGVGPRVGVKVGAGVRPETSLDVSSNRDTAPVQTMTIKAAGTSEAEAERGQTGTPTAPRRVAAEARAPAGVAAGAGRGARTGPTRGGARSAESAKKVTREGGR